jgi:hypothetical protein
MDLNQTILNVVKERGGIERVGDVIAVGMMGAPRVPHGISKVMTAINKALLASSSIRSSGVARYCHLQVGRRNTGFRLLKSRSNTLFREVLSKVVDDGGTAAHPDAST